MNWVPVKSLKPDRIHVYPHPAAGDIPGFPWDAAESHMREGFLPPYDICQLLPSFPLPAFTRRRQWVLSGAIATLKIVAADNSALMKSLRDMNRRYRRA
jgi:hypothetical protein